MRFPNSFNTKEERIELWYEQIKNFLTNDRLLAVRERV